jgi:hypothetical protein
MTQILAQLEGGGGSGIIAFVHLCVLSTVKDKLMIKLVVWPHNGP